MTTPLGDLTAFTSGFKYFIDISTHEMLKINGIYNGMGTELTLQKVVLEEPPIYRGSRYHTTLHILQYVGILSSKS